ncbi:inositol polyphosphate kinase [Besnoitia besnoiti]|uniref:Kinase n=1 Tax=Besnoitia besnoiti TaxID=94643 RepID=A0A2A9M640_BESBE|nr:inositol polyphosphate kinase [Besnoitia besnoiti]PFH31781.1 inositol polyphosphate kinase [Besnoitia besnoiti]
MNIIEAYRHQVGGHSRLMKPRDSSKVYKPLIENEYRFYEKLSALGASNAESGPLHILKKFVPHYYGVTEVCLRAEFQKVEDPPGAIRTPLPDSNEPVAAASAAPSAAAAATKGSSERPREAAGAAEQGRRAEAAAPGDQELQVSRTPAAARQWEAAAGGKGSQSAVGSGCGSAEPVEDGGGESRKRSTNHRDDHRRATDHGCAFEPLKALAERDNDALLTGLQWSLTSPLPSSSEVSSLLSRPSSCAPSSLYAQASSEPAIPAPSSPLASATSASSSASASSSSPASSASLSSSSSSSSASSASSAAASSAVKSERGSTVSGQLRHIVLEDLVYGFKKPCVLDIKMGKRQRKVGASPEKEKRQLEKSLKTTSHELGFRLCGCQYYNKKTDTLCYRDKYWGRKLTKEKVPNAIRQWFWNGSTLYVELIPVLLEKLDMFYSCVAQLKHYRFWSSSLLLVYDGGLCDPEERKNSLDIRMIDFANTIYLRDNPAPDEEYLFGLRNLIGGLHALLTYVAAGPPDACMQPPPWPSSPQPSSAATKAALCLSAASLSAASVSPAAVSAATPSTQASGSSRSQGTTGARDPERARRDGPETHSTAAGGHTKADDACRLPALTRRRTGELLTPGGGPPVSWKSEVPAGASPATKDREAEDPKISGTRKLRSGSSQSSSSSFSYSRRPLSTAERVRRSHEARGRHDEENGEDEQVDGRDAVLDRRAEDVALAKQSRRQEAASSLRQDSKHRSEHGLREKDRSHEASVEQEGYTSGAPFTANVPAYDRREKRRSGRTPDSSAVRVHQPPVQARTEPATSPSSCGPVVELRPRLPSQREAPLPHPADIETPPGRRSSALAASESDTWGREGCDEVARSEVWSRKAEVYEERIPTRSPASRQSAATSETERVHSYLQLYAARARRRGDKDVERDPPQGDVCTPKVSGAAPPGVGGTTPSARGPRPAAARSGAATPLPPPSAHVSASPSDRSRMPELMGKPLNARDASPPPQSFSMRAAAAATRGEATRESAHRRRLARGAATGRQRRRRRDRAFESGACLRQGAAGVGGGLCWRKKSEPSPLPPRRRLDAAAPTLEVPEAAASRLPSPSPAELAPSGDAFSASSRVASESAAAPPYVFDASDEESRPAPPPPAEADVFAEPEAAPGSSGTAFRVAGSPAARSVSPTASPAISIFYRPERELLSILETHSRDAAHARSGGQDGAVRTPGAEGETTHAEPRRQPPHRAVAEKQTGEESGQQHRGHVEKRSGGAGDIPVPAERADTRCAGERSRAAPPSEAREAEEAASRRAAEERTRLSPGQATAATEGEADWGWTREAKAVRVAPSDPQEREQSPDIETKTKYRAHEGRAEPRVAEAERAEAPVVAAGESAATAGIAPDTNATGDERGDAAALASEPEGLKWRKASGALGRQAVAGAERGEGEEGTTKGCRGDESEASLGHQRVCTESDTLAEERPRNNEPSRGWAAALDAFAAARAPQAQGAQTRLDGEREAAPQRRDETLSSRQAPNEAPSTPHLASQLAWERGYPPREGQVREETPARAGAVSRAPQEGQATSPLPKCKADSQVPGATRPRDGEEAGGGCEAAEVQNERDRTAAEADGITEARDGRSRRAPAASPHRLWESRGGAAEGEAAWSGAGGERQREKTDQRADQAAVAAQETGRRGGTPLSLFEARTPLASQLADPSCGSARSPPAFVVQHAGAASPLSTHSSSVAASLTSPASRSLASPRAAGPSLLLSFPAVAQEVEYSPSALPGAEASHGGMGSFAPTALFRRSLSAPNLRRLNDRRVSFMPHCDWVGFPAGLYATLVSSGRANLMQSVYGYVSVLGSSASSDFESSSYSSEEEEGVEEGGRRTEEPAETRGHATADDARSRSGSMSSAGSAWGGDRTRMRFRCSTDSGFSSSFSSGDEEELQAPPTAASHDDAGYDAGDDLAKRRGGHRAAAGASRAAQGTARKARGGAKLAAGAGGRGPSRLSRGRDDEEASCERTRTAAEQRKNAELSSSAALRTSRDRNGRQQIRGLQEGTARGAAGRDSHASRLSLLRGGDTRRDDTNRVVAAAPLASRRSRERLPQAGAAEDGDREGGGAQALPAAQGLAARLRSAGRRVPRQWEQGERLSESDLSSDASGVFPLHEEEEEGDSARGTSDERLPEEAGRCGGRAVCSGALRGRETKRELASRRDGSRSLRSTTSSPGVAPSPSQKLLAADEEGGDDRVLFDCSTSLPRWRRYSASERATDGRGRDRGPDAASPQSVSLRREPRGRGGGSVGKAEGARGTRQSCDAGRRLPARSREGREGSRPESGSGAQGGLAGERGRDAHRRREHPGQQAREGGARRKEERRSVGSHGATSRYPFDLRLAAGVPPWWMYAVSPWMASQLPSPSRSRSTSLRPGFCSSPALCSARQQPSVPYACPLYDRDAASLHACYYDPPGPSQTTAHVPQSFSSASPCSSPASSCPSSASSSFATSLSPPVLSFSGASPETRSSAAKHRGPADAGDREAALGDSQPALQSPPSPPSAYLHAHHSGRGGGPSLPFPFLPPLASTAAQAPPLGAPPEAPRAGAGGDSFDYGDRLWCPRAAAVPVRRLRPKRREAGRRKTHSKRRGRDMIHDGAPARLKPRDQPLLGSLPPAPRRHSLSSLHPEAHRSPPALPDPFAAALQRATPAGEPPVPPFWVPAANSAGLPAHELQSGAALRPRLGRGRGGTPSGTGGGGRDRRSVAAASPAGGSGEEPDPTEEGKPDAEGGPPSVSFVSSPSSVSGDGDRWRHQGEDRRSPPPALAGSAEGRASCALARGASDKRKSREEAKAARSAWAPQGGQEGSHFAVSHGSRATPSPRGERASMGAAAAARGGPVPPPWTCWPPSWAPFSLDAAAALRVGLGLGLGMGMSSASLHAGRAAHFSSLDSSPAAGAIPPWFLYPPPAAFPPFAASPELPPDEGREAAGRKGDRAYAGWPPPGASWEGRGGHGAVPTFLEWMLHPRGVPPLHAAGGGALAASSGRRRVGRYRRSRVAPASGGDEEDVREHRRERECEGDEDSDEHRRMQRHAGGRGARERPDWEETFESGIGLGGRKREVSSEDEASCRERARRDEGEGKRSRVRRGGEGGSSRREASADSGDAEARRAKKGRDDAAGVRKHSGKEDAEVRPRRGRSDGADTTLTRSEAEAAAEASRQPDKDRAAREGSRREQDEEKRKV